MCNKITHNYNDDLYQEVCYHILTMPEDRLPEPNYLRFWFYRVAYSTMTKYGTLGRIIHKPIVKIAHEQSNELANEEAIREAEKFMLSLSEFENRVVILFNELGDMKKVEKATGISYSALRAVKEKLKTFRNENTCNNTILS